MHVMLTNAAALVRRCRLLRLLRHLDSGSRPPPRFHQEVRPGAAELLDGRWRKWIPPARRAAGEFQL